MIASVRAGANSLPTAALDPFRESEVGIFEPQEAGREKSWPVFLCVLWSACLTLKTDLRGLLEGCRADRRLEPHRHSSADRRSRKHGRPPGWPRTCVVRAEGASPSGARKTTHLRSPCAITPWVRRCHRYTIQVNISSAVDPISVGASILRERGR